MQNELVHVTRKEIFTSSIIVSELLEVEHKDLIKTIESIINRKNSGMVNPLKFPQKFIKSSFKNKMNRTYDCYEMNEQAYMKLAMHLKGYAKAELVQDMIIEAFCLMKQVLTNQENSSWKISRQTGVQQRVLETDTIKDFVDYATAQGSQNSKFYYSNITKMTNKALEFILQVKHGEPLRNLASISELGFITVLDNRASQALKHGMEQNWPYKFIYEYVKKEVNTLADALNFKKELK